MKFKLISLNLWKGGILFDSIIEFIRNEKPDILALQEAYNGQDNALEKRFRSINFLQKELNFKHNIFAPSFLDITPAGLIDWGNLILSDFSIIKHNVVFLDVPYCERSKEMVDDWSFLPRNIQHVAFNINGFVLNIFNMQGIWGIDGDDNEQRLKMSETIVNLAKNEQNVILCGDFNVDAKTKTISNIEKYFKNIFQDELKTTFNMNQKKDKKFASAVVDFIFASPDIKIANHYCPQVDISDHFPLVCEIEI